MLVFYYNVTNMVITFNYDLRGLWQANLSGGWAFVGRGGQYPSESPQIMIHRQNKPMDTILLHIFYIVIVTGTVRRSALRYPHLVFKV